MKFLNIDIQIYSIKIGNTYKICMEQYDCYYNILQDVLGIKKSVFKYLKIFHNSFFKIVVIFVKFLFQTMIFLRMFFSKVEIVIFICKNQFFSHTSILS